MATGRHNQLVKQTGEYLVCAELGRRGFIATTFTGNIPGFDIIAVNEKLKSIPIQVKTIDKGDRQFDAREYIKISFSNGIQKVEGKIPLENPDLIYVFVKLKENDNDKDEFYILRKSELQEIIYQNYSYFLNIHKGRRPRNPKSFHATVSTDQLKNYKDKWEIITKNDSI